MSTKFKEPWRINVSSWFKVHYYDLKIIYHFGSLNCFIFIVLRVVGCSSHARLLGDENSTVAHCATVQPIILDPTAIHEPKAMGFEHCLKLLCLGEIFKDIFFFLGNDKANKLDFLLTCFFHRSLKILLGIIAIVITHTPQILVCKITVVGEAV